MSKLITIIGISVILIFTILSAIFAFRELIQAKKENEQLHNYVKQLEVIVGVKDIQLKEAQYKITGLNQAVENLTIKYEADEMYIQDLESKFLSLLSYANVAEKILEANGIYFKKTVGIND